MIREGNQVRLTKKEQDQFRHETGCTKLPTTVGEYNQRMQEVADYYRQHGGGEPEAEVLAQLYEMWKIDETGPEPRLVVDR